MDMDTYEIQDLINEKGIFENSMDLLLQAANNPNYINPLKFAGNLPVYGQPQGNPYGRL